MQSPHEYFGIEDHAFSDFNEDSDKGIIESEYVYHPTNEPDDDTESPMIESEEIFRVSPVYHDPPRRGPAVTEEIIDDTPSTEKIYIPVVTHTEDHIQILQIDNSTTTSVPEIMQMNFSRDLSHEDMSPFLPIIEQVVLKTDQTDGIYEVTEQTSESEGSQSPVQEDLSPFLPEIHEQNNTELTKDAPKKSLRLLDDEPPMTTVAPQTINSTTESVTNSLEDEEKQSSTSKTTTTSATTTPEAIKDITAENLEDHDSNLNEIDETAFQSIQENHLKVIPLSTKKWEKPMNETETIETTTGHFLGDRTFPSTEASSGTSKASDEQLSEMKVAVDFDVSSFFKCPAGQFECSNNGTAIDVPCISISKRCDANRDCLDGSDEVGCEEESCPGHFQCSDRKCLARHLVCDGIDHCSDGGDEKNCAEWKCKFDEFSCGESGACLPNIWQCDGLKHCRNAADESNCPDNCSNNDFFCPTQGSCIPEAWRCDGKSDCIDDEDERFCSCGVGQRKCVSGGGCYDANDSCNGVPQCADGSDEWDCLDLGEQAHPNVSARILSLKFSNDSSYKVCADNWSDKWSNTVCSKLGFGDHLYWTMTNGTSDKNYYKISSERSFEWKFNTTDSCQEGVVALACQEVKCSSNLGQISVPLVAMNSVTKTKCSVSIGEKYESFHAKRSR